MKRVLLTIVVAAAACDANLSGNTMATILGDKSHQAVRGSPIAAVRDKCGAGESSLRRHP